MRLKERINRPKKCLTPLILIGIYPVAYQFRVKFIGINGVQEEAFSEVSGLSVKMSYSTVKEGGNNDNAYRLPTAVTFEKLKLKRGLLKESPLMTWIEGAVKKDYVKPITIVVSLMDSQQIGVVCWEILNAYPVAIKISPFNANKNAVAVEELDFLFESCYRVDCR